jgi:hypothetical protein
VLHDDELVVVAADQVSLRPDELPYSAGVGDGALVLLDPDGHVADEEHLVPGRRPPSCGGTAAW